MRRTVRFVPSGHMTRKSLRPHLNQIRTWVRQGRTDAWIAHQLEVTVQQIRPSSASTTSRPTARVRPTRGGRPARGGRRGHRRRARGRGRAPRRGGGRGRQAGRGGRRRASRRRGATTPTARTTPSRPQARAAAAVGAAPQGQQPLRGDLRPRRGGLRPVAGPGRPGRPGLRRALGGPPPGRGHDRGGPDRDHRAPAAATTTPAERATAQRLHRAAGRAGGRRAPPARGPGAGPARLPAGAAGARHRLRRLRRRERRSSAASSSSRGSCAAPCTSSRRRTTAGCWRSPRRASRTTNERRLAQLEVTPRARRAGRGDDRGACCRPRAPR